MSTADAPRERVLAKVRRALAQNRVSDARRAELDERVRQAPRFTRPSLQAELAAQFCAKLAVGGGTWQRLAEPGETPAAVRCYLTRHKLSSRLVAAPALDRQDGSQTWDVDVDVEFGASRGQHATSLTPCFCAVAETGSVVLLSGPDSPTTLNFLPDDHIVVLYAEQIVAHLEDAFARLRGSGATPRTVNFITGPSKTADVEQTLQIGAHGPRRLHVLLIDRRV